MIQKEINAKAPGKDGNPDKLATIIVNYPENLDEAGQVLGEDAVLTNAFANWRVTLQSNIRALLKSGMGQEQIQEKLGSAIMGIAQVGSKVDTQAAFIAKFKTSTPEEQANMLELLKDAAQE